ncbi:MAG TPA: penicillin-binding protein 2 [Coleofasciculaceae cyanobacterium]
MALSFPSFRSRRAGTRRAAAEAATGKFGAKMGGRSREPRSPRSGSHPSVSHAPTFGRAPRKATTAQRGGARSVESPLGFSSRSTESQRRRLPPLPQRSLIRAPKHRLMLVWVILLCSMLVLALNLFRIQVLQASRLQAQAKSQHMVAFNPITPRRPIVDRAGDVLAIDRPVYTLYAHPYMFGKPKELVAATLSPLINIPIAQLLEKFGSADSGIRLLEAIPEDLANRVERLGEDGLDLEPHQQRLYPQQDLFANIVGYVNLDRQGQAGLEASQEEELQQPIEGMDLSRSGDGSIIPVGLPEDFLQSRKNDLRLQLTVDTHLQRATRYALKQMMKKYSAKRGAVIVMNVNDGSVVSLVSEPSYDPNKFYEAKLERLKDWVLSDLYEPGSTFKPVNLAIALESSAIQADTTVYDEGVIEIEGWPINNSDVESAGGRGELSVSEVLKYSSNVGMVHIMQRMNPGVYFGWLERIGLDKTTGIDLPAEVSGQMKTYQQFTESAIEPATTAFGQGFSLTPMKLIQLHSMVANGGRLVTPHVVQGLVDAKGNFSWKPDLPLPRPIISPEHAKTVVGMMEDVVKDGTGKAAQIPGYRIAGKTGTAQKASPDGGYIDGARITSFIGLLPADAPRYAVLAVVDEPQGEDAYGGTVAAPIVKSVMQSLITMEQIKPTLPEEVLNESVLDSSTFSDSSEDYSLDAEQDSADGPDESGSDDEPSYDAPSQEEP